MVDPAVFEKLFSTAVTAHGTQYLAAMLTIVGFGADALQNLRPKAANQSDWKISLTAQMSISWIEEKDVCNQVTELMKGNIKTRAPITPITGEWSASRRGVAIAGLGQKATPRVLEILIKTQEYSNRTELEALPVALGRLKDRRAVSPLIELMRTSRDSELRTWVAYALGQIGDARAFEVLAEGLQNDANDLELRKTCAQALGALKDSRAVEPLVQVFASEKNNLELRSEAAIVLGTLGSNRIQPQLISALERTQDLEFLRSILSALADVGDRSCIEVLERIAQRHPDELIRESAAEAIATVRKRLQKAP